MLRETGRKLHIKQIKLHIHLLPIYSILSVFKSTNSCFKCLDILCVCVYVTCTHQHNILVIHLAIQLSYLLVLLGLFYIYITYVKQ